MCTVASLLAFRVRVWQIMSRGQGLGARRSPPEGASVGYSPPLRFLGCSHCRLPVHVSRLRNRCLTSTIFVR